ncbi:MAG TPA: flagellar biosynthetic protein FliR [Solirubrobacteraceae bacterium]|nr:flagellar biosynthetic protein FliR [Solirubrobacteraceae bacterium]
MTEADLRTLLGSIGPDQVTGFFLVLARVTPLFVLAPVFSSAMLPPKVRSVVAVGLAIGLTPLAVHGQRIPTDALSVAGLLVEQVLVGLAFSFAVGAVLYAVQAAGGLADMLSGFSFGALVDPINGNQGGVLTSLYSLLGMMMFIAIGGDMWMVRGLARTFGLVPLTGSAPLPGIASGAVATLGSVFIGAVEVAAPVLLAMLVTDVAFGMVSKVVPQVNVFGVGFALKVGVVMLVIAASLPFIGAFMSNQIVGAVQTALGAI